jgi:hypothetical protein
MSSTGQVVEQEKQEILYLLMTTCSELMAALDGVAPALHPLHAQQERWSVLENAEHVVNAEEVTFRIWQKRNGPGSTDRSVDAVVRTKLGGRLKRKSPERLVPQGRIASVAAARKRFLTARAAAVATVGAMPAEALRTRVVPHPMVGGLADGYQLFLIMALHAERHAEQIKETAAKLTADGGTA